MSIRTRKAAKDAQTIANIEARYDAAGTGRRMKGWQPPSSGPARATEGTSRLRDRARDSVRNDWASASASQKWTTTLVGTGVTPRWVDERHTAIWDDFVPQSDADGTLDAYGQQALGVRAWFDAGEVFLRHRWRSDASPLEIPVQVQLIESEYCPVFDADQRNGMPAGNRIRQGVEFNRYGRRIAYWMHREHPGDSLRGMAASSLDLVRVPAREISHVFEPKRPGQIRGVSELATTLARVRSGADFEDAVLDRQKLANLFTVFFTKPLPTDWHSLKVDPNTGMPVEWTNKGKPMAGLEPGMAFETLPGEKVEFANPPEAGVSFADYLRSLHLGTAAGGGLPYELLSGDIRDVGDRTLRVLIQEFRRFASQRQWHIVIPRLCQPVVEWVGAAAVIKGRLRASELKAFTRPEWSPHGWDYLHPVQDVQGKKLAIEAGLTTRVAVIGERGDDPRKVAEQRKQDKALGLVELPPAPAPAPASTARASVEPAVAQMLASTTEALQQIVAATARMPAPSVDPTIAQMLAGMTSLMQQMASTTAQMAATVTAFATNRPEPTPVNVSVAPTVTVEPTPVNVSVTPQLALPNRQIDTEVLERDDNGNPVVVRSVQTTVQ